MKMKKTKLLYFPIFAALIFGCNNQWDDYVKVSDSNLSGSVLEAIEKNKDLSMFYGFLETTGYKEILSGANNYTVFAPVNNALESYKESSDDIKKNIVRNHIAFLTQKNEDLIGTVKMINGKNLNMDNINLTEEEILCSNGILRTASNVVLAKDNIYELINSYKENNQMAAIISNAGYSVMDIDKSVQLGVDKETGKPYYDTVWSYFNPFLDSIAIDNEDASYKMLLLSDDNFITLRDKYAKYMVQVNDDSEKTLTNAFASESLIYDLICNTEENDFISVNGINIDMENASVTDELEASNGSLIIADNEIGRAHV